MTLGWVSSWPALVSKPLNIFFTQLAPNVYYGQNKSNNFLENQPLLWPRNLPKIIFYKEELQQFWWNIGLKLALGSAIWLTTYSPKVCPCSFLKIFSSSVQTNNLTQEKFAPNLKARVILKSLKNYSFFAKQIPNKWVFNCCIKQRADADQHLV